jgi:predicted nucleic acid-binding protein
MTVVADSSPLIALAKIEQIDLLPRLLGPILIPEAVYNEIVVLGAGMPGSSQIARADWIEVRSVSDPFQVELLQDDLDIGEAEAIVLAQEVQARRLLIDEMRARAAAELLGIPHTGTIGLLLLAKRAGYLDQIAPFLQQLRRHNFYLSSTLYQAILTQAHE